jgi:hypothetical protein
MSQRVLYRNGDFWVLDVVLIPKVVVVLGVVHIQRQPREMDGGN